MLPVTFLIAIGMYKPFFLCLNVLKLRLVMSSVSMIDLRIRKMIALEFDMKKPDADKCHELEIQGYDSSVIWQS